MCTYDEAGAPPGTYAAPMGLVLRNHAATAAHGCLWCQGLVDTVSTCSADESAASTRAVYPLHANDSSVASLRLVCSSNDLPRLKLDIITRRDQQY